MLQIEPFFDQVTATFTYVIWDEATLAAAVIDPVLDYDQYAGKVSTKSADRVVAFIMEHRLILEYILETHIHADHITAARYIKGILGGKVGIGRGILAVLLHWVPAFNSGADTPMDGSQFDLLFDDGDEFALGESRVRVMHTPGHTPACASYLAGESAVFVGDTLFMPDVGTARTDFPGGDARQLYRSIQKLFALSGDTRVFVGHDYPVPPRKEKCYATIDEQKAHNALINDAISEEEYVTARNQRDQGKPVPKLLLPAIQVNMRCGDFGARETNGMHYVKVPIAFEQ